MSLPFYHYLHLIGLILVFIGFGGLFSSEGAKKAMMWHGIGLVISIVSGFGMLAKLGIMGTMPVWAWIKIGLWLVLGFLPVLAKRRVIAAPLVVLIAAIVGAALAFIGYTYKTGFSLGS
jgi:NAD/NADP transhydrogenase beta subunit